MAETSTSTNPHNMCISKTISQSSSPYLCGLLILFTLGIGNISVQAQTAESFTLEDCIERAKDYSIQARQGLIAVQIEEENRKEAQQSILPNLNAGASWVNNWGLFIDPFTT